MELGRNSGRDDDNIVLGVVAGRGQLGLYNEQEKTLEWANQSLFPLDDLSFAIVSSLGFFFKINK